MKIGYARVSTDDQHTENQIAALVAAGCDRENIYQDVASGGVYNRPQLHRALGYLRRGDQLVVWKFDRLSRSLGDLIRIMEAVAKTGADFKSLTESIDTATPSGKAMFHMLGVFAEFERSMIKERTHAGLERAKKEGKRLGPPVRLSPARQAAVIAQVKAGKSQSLVAYEYGVSKATVSRLVAREMGKDWKKMKVA
jgi:DNA invertase Pin-like site-specific DNA recombinase